MQHRISAGTCRVLVLIFLFLLLLTKLTARLAAVSVHDPEVVPPSEGDSAGVRAHGSLLYESSSNTSTCDVSSTHSQRQQPMGDRGSSELRAATAEKSLQDSSTADAPADGSKTKLLSSIVPSTLGSKQDRFAIPVHHPVQHTVTSGERLAS